MRSTRSSSKRKPTAAARSKSCCCRWSRRAIDLVHRHHRQRRRGYHSEDNLKQLEARSIEALIADNGYAPARRALCRSGAAQGQARSALRQERKASEQATTVSPVRFPSGRRLQHCICPARKRLYRNGGNCNKDGREAIQFSGTKRDCEKCPLRAQCLRHPQRSKVRQVAIFVGKHAKRRRTRPSA